MICNFTVASGGIRIDCKKGFRHAFNLYVPQGEWSFRMLDAAGKEVFQRLETVAESGFIAVPESDAVTIQLSKK